MFPRPSQVPTKIVFYSIFGVCFIFLGLGGSSSRSENHLQTQIEMVQSFQCMNFQVWNHVKPCETPTAPVTIFYGSWLSHTTLLFRYVSMINETSNIMDVANVPNWNQNPKSNTPVFYTKSPWWSTNRLWMGNFPKKTVQLPLFVHATAKPLATINVITTSTT